MDGKMPSGRHDSPVGGTAQLRAAAPVLVLVYGATSVLVLVAAIGTEAVDRPLSDVTRDPATVAKEPVYVGALSNVGVLAWWTAAVACLVAAAVLWRRRNDVAAPLGAAGLLAATLAVDDLFLLHDAILPDELGIPEPIAYVAYAAAALAFTVAYRVFLRRTRWMLLVLVLLFFGCSIAIDLVVSEARQAEFAAVEDIFKLFGIATWTAYWIPLALAALSGDDENAALR
jgi:hypothetical protein